MIARALVGGVTVAETRHPVRVVVGDAVVDDGGVMSMWYEDVKHGRPR